MTSYPAPVVGEASGKDKGPIGEDVRNGDELRLLLEKKTVEGRFLSYGNILGGEYKGKFKTYRFFWYENEDKGIAAYFTDKGKGVKKEFLKKKLKK